MDGLEGSEGLLEGSSFPLKTVRHYRGHLLFEAVRLSTSTPPHLLLKGGGCTSTRNNGVNSVLVGVGQRITNRFLTLFEESATVWKDH